MKSDLVDLEVEIHHRTERAILVTHDGETKQWLPLAQIEVEQTGSRKGTVTLPEWLALERGLI